jgi:uncharacterized membrane protein
MGDGNKTVVAVVLAGFVGLAVVVLAIGAVINGRSLSVEETAILSSVLGAAVGAVATYLGVKKGDGETPSP